MPRLAVFPKCFMDPLCQTGTMSLAEWIDLAGTLDVDGLEFYAGFLDLRDPAQWGDYRRRVEDQHRSIPMLCCSPDFTHPDRAFRLRQIDQEKAWIDMAAALGASYCRVLSGQRRPEVSRAAGLDFAVECIRACLPHAAAAGVTLVIENHYKDNYWTYPEFAQHADLFVELVGRVDSPWFGVNFDPSNTLLAGEDPLALLERVKRRVVTMHASDRYLASGTLEDLRREEDARGYAARLKHGEIGQGLNDFDAIFRTLAAVDFEGWISIEDGENGLDELQRSAAFLRSAIARHWPPRAEIATDDGGSGMQNRSPPRPGANCQD
jgi:sugar phosphate isomerase/epimerase